MTVSAQSVILYAATPHDFQMALGASGVAGIPMNNVVGNYYTAWSDVHAGNRLVLAVGGAALNALYYNPCNWVTPNREPGGHTPFVMTHLPAASLPGANYFVNCAGYAAEDTYKIATMLAYFAVSGHYPNGFGPLPQPIKPSTVCPPHSAANVTCPC